ncbi:hypothetical protein M8C17_21075 [Micromonospora sp. RHAY321]|uniref:hypothetical protein n=1 Tax=Micromonospora sp. RHAY321 TaxID=2944807 RepID=UPI00207CEC2C|nr:hypothetical protein [Micromonospora sp. RHAY321]MCO1597648.1 hypothetical protein [Micromonospora sp. RHAY321]
MIRGQQYPKAVTLPAIMFCLIDAMSDENVTAEHLKGTPVPVSWDQVRDPARCQLDTGRAHVLQRATHMITRLRPPG